MAAADWNAAVYHEVSAPQQTWGHRVLARLVLDGDEHVLDLGCGTGRLTADLAQRVPRGRVVAADRSAAMIGTASEWLREHAPRVALVRADGAALPFTQAFDAIFSTATFHWIPDHDALFAELFRVLRAGGRVVAQCGGGPNLQRLLARAHVLMDGPRYARFFGQWQDPWYFADVSTTIAQLERAGLEPIDVNLEYAPTPLPNREAYQEFLACVCVRHHIDRLPPDHRKPFVAALADAAAGDDPPFTLDYWRLNIDARRPQGA